MTRDILATLAPDGSFPQPVEDAIDARIDANIGAAVTPVAKVNVVAASGATLTLPDVLTATVHDVTLTAGCTFTFPTPAPGKSFVVRLTQDGVGNRIPTFPITVRWPGGVVPTLSTGAGKQDLLSFIAVGNSYWLGTVMGLDMRPLPTATLASLTSPIAVPHRGLGVSYGIENALSSYDLAAVQLPRTGLVLDADVQKTSDGALVLMHDATVDRTTNGTGTISAMTLAQFSALFMRDFPFTNGTISTEHPPTFDQFLDKMAATGASATIECKVDDTTVAQAMVDKIVARGFQQRVIFCSGNGPVLNVGKAAGMQTQLVQFGTPLTPSALATSVGGGKPDSVCYDFTDATNYSDTWLSGVIAAGVTKLWPYTLNGRRSTLVLEQARLLGLGATMPGYYSNDAIYTAAYNTQHLATDATITAFDHGWLQSFYGTGSATVASGAYTSETAKRPYPTGGWIKFDGASTNGQCMHFGSAARTSAPSKIEFTVRFDTLAAAGSAASRYAILWSGMTDDAPVGTNTAGSNRGVGNVAILRETGAMGIYVQNRPIGGTTTGSSTTLVTGTSAAPTAGAVVPCRFEYLAGGTMKFTRLDTGDSITSPADTTYRGGHFSLGKNGGDNVYSFKDVVVTP